MNKLLTLAEAAERFAPVYNQWVKDARREWARDLRLVRRRDRSLASRYWQMLRGKRPYRQQTDEKFFAVLWDQMNVPFGGAVKIRVPPHG